MNGKASESYSWGPPKFKNELHLLQKKVSWKYPREIKVNLWKSSKGKELSSEIHNSPWKSSVDEKGPMNFFNVNNCMNAKL